MSYDRMNPKPKQLWERLRDYAAKDYAVEAYSLSRAEALFLLGMENEVSMMDAAFIKRTEECWDAETRLSGAMGETAHLKRKADMYRDLSADQARLNELLMKKLNEPEMTPAQKADQAYERIRLTQELNATLVRMGLSFIPKVEVVPEITVDELKDQNRLLVAGLRRIRQVFVWMGVDSYNISKTDAGIKARSEIKEIDKLLQAWEYCSAEEKNKV
jgi:hypothetical protein